MFRSTTFRLTGWYLFVLMTLSIIFSVVIYQVATDEVGTRLQRFQTGIQQSQVQFQEFTPLPRATESLRVSELDKAESNLSIELFYVNLCVLIAGGFISYFLARRHLMPIEKAHEAQSRFTSDASHELRTPLAIMKTELEVALRDKSATVDDLKEILSSNLEEVDKLSKLAEMLLSLSQLDHTKLKLGPVNLNKVTKGIIADFSHSSDRIILSAKKQLIINGNEMAIADLVKILVDNALQYSPKDSQIFINIHQINQTAQLEIINTGPGIKPDKLSHIFDRFYRADSSRTGGKQRGYGLGLSLAKKIIDLHNGEIRATSIPDQTTTFAFSLPLVSSIQAKTQN
jgi:signal transduction histidine kinase